MPALVPLQLASPLLFFVLIVFIVIVLIVANIRHIAPDGGGPSGRLP